MTMTVRGALTAATARLEMAAQLRQSAARDALLLLLHAAGISRAELHADPARALTDEEQRTYEAFVQRRMRHEPIQYIVGEQEFYGLALRVGPAVLIPRPETEHLVEAVLAEMDGVARPRIVDVGTGSGAIAIALAVNLPQAEMVAADLSREALQVARENAARHGVAERIRFVESDLMDRVEGEFDALVSNPPYVASGDREMLHPEVREYEPATALFAGSEGLAIYRRLIPQAASALKQDGLLAMEIGLGQDAALAELLVGWTAVRFVKDLQGIPRVVVARRA